MSDNVEHWLEVIAGKLDTIIYLIEQRDDTAGDDFSPEESGASQRSGAATRYDAGSTAVSQVCERCFGRGNNWNPVDGRFDCQDCNGTGRKGVV